jgi:hypothetical protein
MHKESRRLTVDDRSGKSPEENTYSYLLLRTQVRKNISQGEKMIYQGMTPVDYSPEV